MNSKTRFEKTTFTAHLVRLESACRWLDISRGRAASYCGLVRELFERDARSREHILAYNESCEIVEIFELWEQSISRFPGLQKKITDALRRGPVLRESENIRASSNMARNDAFGYFVAGKLLSIGIPVVAVSGIVASASCKSDADMTLELDGALVDVECKRSQSERSLLKRAKEARDQIQCPSRAGRRGIIAIDASVLVRPAGTVYESESTEIAEQSISRLLETEVASKVIPSLTESIFGFLLFARVPAMTRVRRFAIVSSQGAPIDQFRPDSVSTWLVVTNEACTGGNALGYIGARLL